MSTDVPTPLSLKRRVMGASFWSLSGYASSYVLRVGSSVLMTRLLLPQMFGVMAIAWMVMTGLAMFSNVGLRPNILQNPRGSDPSFLNTAWALQIIRGLLMWLLALSVSLLIIAANHFELVPKASVYADPALPYVLAVVSISAVIAAFESTKLAEASRYLSLGRVTLIQIIAQISGLICMITWALHDRSIWALVAGGLCPSVVQTLLSHIWLRGTPNRWHWDPSAFTDIFHFGKWMFLSSILGFFVNNSDRVLLGGLVDSATLGIYSIALTIVNAFGHLLTALIGNVSYPAISEVVRERSPQVKRSLYRFHILTASFSYFCAGGLIGSGNTLIKLLYDPRYWQAGWMIEVLAVGLLAVPFQLAQYSLLAHGMPRIFTNIVAIPLVVTIVLVPLGFHFFGLQGTVLAIAASKLSSVPAIIYYQRKYNLLDLSKELLALPALLAGFILGRGFDLVIDQLVASFHFGLFH